MTDTSNSEMIRLSDLVKKQSARIAELEEKLKPARHLKLYVDDFNALDVWEEICNVVRVDYEMVDEIDINFHTGNINPYREGEYSPEYKREKDNE